MKSTKAGLRKTVAVMAIISGLSGGFSGPLSLQAAWAQPAATAAESTPVEGTLIAPFTPPETPVPASLSAPVSGLPVLQPVAVDAGAPKAAALLGATTLAELQAKSTASAKDVEAASAAIAEISALTGLPQNFVIVLAETPAIAAVILPDETGIPRRVLVIPQGGLATLQQARAAQDWPLLAVLGHEIAHHLMGHSLIAGADHPREEIEADRYAGYLLERMGADLTQALAAIDAEYLQVPELRLATLPRLEVLAEGWLQACTEDGRCRPSTPAAEALPQAATRGVMSQARPVPRPETGQGADPALRAENAAQAVLARLRDKLALRLLPANAPAGAEAGHAVASGYRLPLPDPDAVPLKFGRFVYDPAGLVNEKEIASLARDAYAYAQKPGVEIVTIVADSLHGLSAEAYARTMLRQLQVGQQDLGNGAVIVIAPNEGSSAVALGAGVISAITAEPSAGSPTSGDEALAVMRSRAAAFVEGLKQGSDPKVPTVAMALTEAAHAIMRSPDVANAEWFVRYPSLEAALAAQEADWTARAKSGAAYDPAKDPVGRRIVTLRATVTGALDPEAAAAINPEQLRLYGSAVAVSDGAGEAYTLFVPPVATAVGSAPLVAGRDYRLIARVVENGGEKPVFALMSYDDLTPLP